MYGAQSGVGGRLWSCSHSKTPRHRIWPPFSALGACFLQDWLYLLPPSYVSIRFRLLVIRDAFHSSNNSSFIPKSWSVTLLGSYIHHRPNGYHQGYWIFWMLGLQFYLWCWKWKEVTETGYKEETCLQGIRMFFNDDPDKIIRRNVNRHWADTATANFHSKT